MKYKLEIYRFNDIPKKRNYLLKRLERIYPSTHKKIITDILDSIKIKFRDQEERGASNHNKKIIYLPIRDLKSLNLISRKDIIDYLEHLKSVVTHETMHIFQNLSKNFPDVKYLERQDDGSLKINYDKYWNDPGEKQSRLEQVNELLNWGFTKKEIIDFLYNRNKDDRELWNRIIDHAIYLRKK